MRHPKPEVVAMLAAGHTGCHAARVVGLHTHTVLRWMSKPDFRAEVARAREIATEMRLWRITAPPAEAEPLPKVAVLTFPVSDQEGVWTLTATMLAALAETFDIDVLAAARRCLDWLVANPPSRKTSIQMPAFLATWIAREAEGDAYEKALFYRRRRELERAAKQPSACVADGRTTAEQEKTL